MKIEQLKRGKEIQKEIELLKEYIEPLTWEETEQNKRTITFKAIIYSHSKNKWLEESYNIESGRTPECVKKSLETALKMTQTIIVGEVNARIKELNKEFESL